MCPLQIRETVKWALLERILQAEDRVDNSALPPSFLEGGLPKSSMELPLEGSASTTPPIRPILNTPEAKQCPSQHSAPGTDSKLMPFLPANTCYLRNNKQLHSINML